MSSGAHEIIVQANKLLAKLPVPNVSQTTAKVYLAALRRMLREEIVDPLRPGDARDTFQVRRAALHGGTWLVLTRGLSALASAGERGDRVQARRTLENLARIVERCELAIERDPPASSGISPFSNGPSRWVTSDIPHPRRGKGSKKHVLGKLPTDWMTRVWDASPTNWAYRDALSIHMLTPVRPGEFVPSHRDGRWVGGVAVALVGRELIIGVAPVKTHRGKYGTGESNIRLRADSEHAAVKHLVGRCRVTAGRRLIVSLEGTNAMRKALEKLGRRALGNEVKLTPYVFRHQAIADYKKTAGAGAVVAMAAGHCTDRTQSHYGRVEHGKRRAELIAVSAKRPPQTGNVARAKVLSRPPTEAMRP